jgi:hypothetical protein
MTPTPPEPTGPNYYAHLIRCHYQDWLPDRLAQIPLDQRDSYFSALGEVMADRVEVLEQALRGPDPAEEEFMSRLGRFNMARLQAEEVARAEFLPTPEEDLEEEREPNLILDGYWESAPIPVVEDPAHPWWIAERRRIEDAEEDERWRLEREQDQRNLSPGSNQAPKTT